jgi:UDP-N-acetylmuramoyl-L-alanyl-D-glutamate--2,6-diaminopimelate ligase
MKAIHLSELLSMAGVAARVRPGSDPRVTGVSTDSRRVEPGHLFVGIRGTKADGATFAPEAIARGARAIVAETPAPASHDGPVAWVEVADARRAAALLARAWYSRPDEAMALVGITGTNGKTSVAFLVEAMATAAGRRAGRIGTVGASYGGTSLRADLTTPDAVDLYRLLAEMREAGVEVVALEVSSHALALRRVEGARFEAASFLNLGRDHLDFHGTPEAYFEAKASLVEGLGKGATAVLSADDERIAGLARRTPARVVTFGRSASADVRLLDERCSPEGCSARLETAWGSFPIRTPLVGRFQLENVAAAAALGLALGFGVAAIEQGAASVRAVPGRLEPVGPGSPFSVFVDYAHTPQALEKMLDAVREISPGRILLVFGCGGDRDRGKRPEMGRIAAEKADLVFLTSDNPRSEDPGAIALEVLRGATGLPGAGRNVRIVLDRREAIFAAVGEARPGDAVVVAGKGHETTQTIGDRIEPFDDREAARSALRSVGIGDGHRARA